MKPTTKPISLKRRALAAGLASLPAAFSLPARSQGLTPVKFTMDWRIEGPSVFFLLPLAKGYFKEEGLDVTMDIGTGSAAAVQRIASGAYDMGSGDMSALIEYTGNNPNQLAMQAVYQIYETAPGAVFYWKKSGIKVPKDLAGKRLAASVFDAVYRAFPLIENTNSLPTGAVKWAIGDPQLKEQLMARGEADGLTAFFATGLLNLNARGVKTEDIGWFKFGDMGIHNLYGNCVMASTRMIAEKPAAVAAFVRAFNRGFKEVVAKPEEAMQYAKARDPLINEKTEVERLKLALQDIATPNARADGFGSIRKAKLESQVDAVSTAYKLKSRPSPDLFFNSSFLPAASARRA